MATRARIPHAAIGSATTPDATASIRLSVRSCRTSLERLAPLWPSVQRQVTGSATIELQSPNLGFSAYEGRLGLQVATAELLGVGALESAEVGRGEA